MEAHTIAGFGFCLFAGPALAAPALAGLALAAPALTAPALAAPALAARALAAPALAAPALAAPALAAPALAAPALAAPVVWAEEEVSAIGLYGCTNQITTVAMGGLRRSCPANRLPAGSNKLGPVAGKEKRCGKML